MATRTAAQRREEAKLEYDAFMAACPSRQLLDRISDKWVGLVLAAMADRPRRYGELSKDVAGVSPKMLTQTLRSLERDGLVARYVTAEVPVRVDYELTDLGHSLMPLMRAIKSWAEAHMDDVHVARSEYDRTAASA
ncbi:winged helix-turn-helix transcriptional regulator [Antrihabitans spumae]|uniref:Winged helix-turn-helix transcriptional regulator n=1 Tax=Antrihabitans spumae TaxID=3373370 RepID=A0ABW7K191_9NOCA